MTRRRPTRREKPERRFVVWSQRRETPDLPKLARALLAVVLAEQQPTSTGTAEDDSDV